MAAAQGVSRNKDQMTLRREFCQRYGRRLLPGIDRFVILGVSLKGGMVPKADDEIDGASLHIRDTTWEAVAGITSHPCAEEVQKYLQWKARNSKLE